MRRLILTLTIVCLLLARVPAFAQQPYAFDLFSAYLESMRTQAGIPGLSAAIVGDTTVLWEHAYGRQDLTRNIATRPDTPFHVDGLTQIFTATMVLQCVEEKQLSLTDRVDKFVDDSPEPAATIGQLLSHTTSSNGGLVFAYKLERLEPLKAAIRSCTDNSYRETLANLLQQNGMYDSVPGSDVTSLKPPAEGVPTEADVDRYTSILERLPVPYAVDSRGRASTSQYSDATLTPSGGLISTVRDLAQFDLALRGGSLIRPDTLAAAWRPPSGIGTDVLPHGLGWFVQTYNGEPVVWQFGVSDNASSSLIITLPRRALTLILLANSDRLVRPLPLATGDLMVSPFGRLFASFFVR